MKKLTLEQVDAHAEANLPGYNRPANSDFASAKCIHPQHGGEDRKPSLSINVRTSWAECRGCGFDGPYHRYASECRLSGAGGLTEKSEPLAPKVKRQASTLGKEVDWYTYRQADGTPFYQVVQFDPKDFRLKHYSESAGDFKNGRNKLPLIPFKLPEIHKADPGAVILWLEGEKDVETGRSLGFLATTTPQGAKSWYLVSLQSLGIFIGRTIVLIPDNDEPGRVYVMSVGQTLEKVGARVSVLELPGLPEKGDLTDWKGLAATNTGGQLASMIQASAVSLADYRRLYPAASVEADKRPRPELPSVDRPQTQAEPRPTIPLLERALLAMASQTEGGQDGVGLNRSDAANLVAHIETVKAGSTIAPALRGRALKILSKYEKQLLDLGFNINDLYREEKQLADEAKASSKGDKERTQVEKLHDLAEDWKFILFEGQPYAVVVRQNEDGSSRKDTLRFSRGGVRQALMQAYYNEHSSSPAADALKQVCDSLEARAIFEGKQATVWIRTAEEDGVTYLDLADELGRVAAVNGSGWTITQDPPVHFQRTAKMLPLPLPVRGGSIQELRIFINVDDGSFILIVAWLLFGFCPRYPHPILLLEGIEGSAKSTIARILRGLLDPNSVTLRKAPRDGEDIAVAAANNWVVAFDNVSQSIEKLSDEFCGLATGSGHARRAHYSNDEESSFSYLRPALFTALPGLLGPADFVSRTLRAVVPVITDENRLLEPEIGEDKAWEQARPRILGAFLDAVACAMANQGKKRLAKLPRLADFAQTIHNAEDALPWAPGAFIETFYNSRLGQVESVLESDPLAVAIRNLLSQDSSYEDGATDFIKHLATKTNDNGRSLPHPVKLPTHLRRLEHSLRQVGIGIRFRRVQGSNKIGVYLTEKHNFAPPEDRGKQPAPTRPQTDLSQTGTGSSRGWVGENNPPPTRPLENLPAPYPEADGGELPTPFLAQPAPKNELPAPLPAPCQNQMEPAFGGQNGVRGRVGAGISPITGGDGIHSPFVLGEDEEVI